MCNNHIIIITNLQIDIPKHLSNAKYPDSGIYDSHFIINGGFFKYSNYMIFS